MSRGTTQEFRYVYFIFWINTAYDLLANREKIASMERSNRERGRSKSPNPEIIYDSYTSRTGNRTIYKNKEDFNKKECFGCQGENIKFLDLRPEI